MGARRVVIEFLGKDKSFGSTADKMGSKTDRLGARMRTVGKVAALGLGAGAVLAAKGLYDMGKAAMEDQRSASLLAKQLHSSAGATKEQVAQTERWITAQGKALGVADDDLRPALAKLVRATGDVGKAQKLASLAMDVSAGSGKDLSAVSQALAKAQNGNVAGLARLGIATKNADGSTKSLAQVTADLSKQFGGAATTNANTLSGKVGRLKLVLSETAESIGYKLLPVATKLADWFLDKGIPAIEKFADGMKEGSGAGGDTAEALHEIGDVARETFSVVGKLVGVFAGMPGAAQKATVLAGAALLIAHHFEEAHHQAELYHHASTMATAESMALRGAALAAGIGLAALSSKASSVSPALGALTSAASGAALGFAVGGPFGAAVGGAAGLLSGLGHKSDGAAEAQARLKESVKTVAGTLDQETGALGKLTRATVAKTLADGGAFTAAQKVGVSYKDVLNAALGNAAATKRVDAATQAYLQTNAKNIGSAQAAKRVTDTLTTAVHGTSSAIDGERRHIDQANSALGHLNGKHATGYVRMNTSNFTAGLRYVIASMNRIGALSTSVKVGLHASDYPGNAKGTNNWRGGTTWVGEKGPELLNLPKGSQIIPNHQTGLANAAMHAAPQALAVVQLLLDGKVIHQALLKRKRDGGIDLGLA